MKRRVLSILLVVSLMFPAMPVMAAEVQDETVVVQEEGTGETVEVELTEPEETPIFEETEILVADETEESEAPVTEDVVQEETEAIETFVVDDEVLGAKVIEGDYIWDKNSIDGTGNPEELNKDWIINGNLALEKITNIDLNGHTLTVNGDLITGNLTHLKCNGGKLIVRGNCVLQGTLHINNATVEIGKDFRLQGIDQDGDYVEKKYGSLEMNGADAHLSVGGAFVTDMNCSSIRVSGGGTITLKGDLLQLSNKGWLDFSKVKFILDGNGVQNIVLPCNNILMGNKFNYLQINNPNVIVSGEINATLVSDGTIKAGNDGLLLSGLNVNNHSLTIQGDVTASGAVTLGDGGGHLTVTGNYTQDSNSLNVGKGTIDIGGDFALQRKELTLYLGMPNLVMQETAANLNIEGDFILNEATESVLKYGIIRIKGDFIQKDSNKNFVASNGHRVILNGEPGQTVTFNNSSNTFNILELTKLRIEYTFSPAKCWNTLVEVDVEWPFMDIPIKDGNWKYEAAKYAYTNNIMNGVDNPDGTLSFKPDDPMSRAMFCTVIYRMAGNPAVTYEPFFADVPAGKWYSNAIVWAYRRGIVNGYPDGTFGVSKNITRQEMAKMLKEYADVQGYNTRVRGNLSGFVDYQNVSGWANDYMQWAVGSGMISGKENNGKKYLDPKGNTTRAECATMLMRFMEKY